VRRRGLLRDRLRVVDVARPAARWHRKQ
jgi:hypothetical protein